MYVLSLLCVPVLPIDFQISTAPRLLVLVLVLLLVNRTAGGEAAVSGWAFTAVAIAFLVFSFYEYALWLTC